MLSSLDTTCIGAILLNAKISLKNMVIFMYLRLFLVLCVLASTSCALADTVKFGIFPSNDPAKLQQVMEVLATYLHEKTGDHIEIVVTRDYEELLHRLEDGSLDLAWINTLNYIRAKTDLPTIQYVTTYVEKNEETGVTLPFYQSYIVTLNNSGIKKIDEARNKRFAYTDPDSTSGYAYPHMLLHKMGIAPSKYFKKVFFLKKHDRVVQALLAGSIDLGAMSDGTYFTATRKNGERFTILAKSDPIPLDAIVANSKLSQEQVLTYRKVLVEMPEDHAFCKAMRAILGWSAAGFATRDDAFYNSVREALQQ